MTQTALRLTSCALGALWAVLLLAGCGAGAGGSDLGVTVPGGSQAGSGLQVLAPALPAAVEGRAIEPVRLSVAEAAPADLSWCVWDGALPEGVRLDEDGLLHGTPRDRGFSVFSVHVTDGARAGVATLALAVDAFGLYACAGLTAGEAWRNRGVRVAVAGATGAVVFDTTHSDSRGQWRDRDDRGATWFPGGAGDSGCVDVLRATDVETGRSATLSLTVRDDPTEGLDAEFGATDVWYVNLDRKTGTHPYATDMQAALAALGLRAAASTDALGRPADRLAESWMRVEVLRALNVFFLREPDGSAGARGLPVSFPYEEPGAGYGKPMAAAFVAGAPARFNEISVVDGSAAGVLGTAFTDDAANRLCENDTSAGGRELGAFVNVLVEYFEIMYPPRALRAEPVHGGDIAALRALLHGEPSPGGRYDAIARVGRRFAEVLAVVLAHEIGHSLGLGHTAASEPDSLMSSSAPILPWSKPAFLPEDVAALQARLPGIGRFDAPHASKPGLPDGGTHVCAGKTCHLHAPLLRTTRPGSKAASPQETK